MFNQNQNPVNILPHDGTALYYGKIFNQAEANFYMNNLFHSIEWKNDEAKIFGKHYITKRKAAWYGNKPFAYTYSNTTKYALPWTTELLQIKQTVETVLEMSFNSCLLNLYHDGQEGMAWHSDDEKALARESGIASVSFGAIRRFAFKHKTHKTTVDIVLDSGSLLLMKDDTQANWLHRLPKSTKITQPRINLTFRNIRE